MTLVAILGYGVVGSGVAEIIRKNGAGIEERTGNGIKVKKILDIRDFPDSPDRELFTKNADEIFNDPEISIIAETIGGVGIAYEFTKRALKAGKHVVTSNKELVAAHGPDLLQLARDNGVYYLFEASVGGGIPIIRPMNKCLAANEINAVVGILNGTTNYILTQMKREKKDFRQALEEAQQNGYAEKDPAADIEGYDACRKLAILSSIAYSEFIDYNYIPTEGISSITQEDFEYADKIGATIKLIAMSEKKDGKIYARVSPALVDKTHPLASVEDVFNAIMVSGNAVGETIFYGRGAGKLPTASAVVADIIDIAGKRCVSNVWKIAEHSNVADLGKMSSRFFVRLNTDKASEARQAVNSVLGDVRWIEAEDSKKLGFITPRITEAALRTAIGRLGAFGTVESRIRILEQV